MSYNRLGQETSPYLLQHKDNPVHWWPWGGQAFAEARRLDRPILLSVGYAACHWCHVMAHESFENPEIAAVMNALYINVKVDREERPDVDALYMAALHALGENGGWPLTMFLTPAGEPFWGGTYFPPTPRYGRPSFTTILREIARIYEADREKVQHNAEALRAAVQPQLEAATGAAFDLPALASFASRMSEAMDPENGGMRGAPKFPNCGILEFLWAMGLRHGAPHCMDAVENTLRHICQGGIYDHIGGGFARYAVDEHWLVPHFEKMLYDNALLLNLMTEVWKERPDPLFAARITETANWLLREMVAPDGGFASSYDADSEGHEGKFYVWSRAEIEDCLGTEDAAFFARIYDVTDTGNWEGTNILNRLGHPDTLSGTNEARLAVLRARLFERRASRIAPGWDDKVLADWNGLAISALTNAADTFNEPTWLAAAEAAYDFIKIHVEQNGRLLHSYRAGHAKTPAVATDYANMIAAALRLHLTTGDPGKLADAARWAETIHTHYWAEPHGGYYLSAADTGDLIARTLAARDDAVPSANATMLANFAALHQITGEDRYRHRAEALTCAFTGEALRHAAQHTGFFNALAANLEPQHIVLIPGSGETEMRDALKRLSLPGTVVQWLAKQQGSPPVNSPAYGKRAIDGKATAYICSGPQCSAPVTTPDDLLQALRASRRTVFG